MTALRGARLSTLARCVRQCAYTALDAPRDEAPMDMTTYFARGHLFNHYVGQQLRAKHGKDAVRSEVDIPWPLGVGHADHVVNGMLAVEVVSTVTPSPHTFGFKARQLKSYMHFGGYSDGAVYVIDPSSLKREDVLPIKLTDEDREEIDMNTKLVGVAVDLGRAMETNSPTFLPRVCRKPSDARGYLCQYASTCFADWEAPPATVNDTEDARRAALDLYQAKQRERNLNAQLKVAEANKQKAAAELGELLPAGEFVTVGPFQVRIRGPYTRTTIKKELRDSGLLSPDLLDPYVSESDPWYVSDIKRDGDAPVLTGDDFGDNPLLDEGEDAA